MAATDSRKDALASNESAVYEHIGVEARHQPPRVNIDPNRELGWMRRILPLIRQHRRPLVIGSISGVVALVLQVAVPAAARSAIDSTIASDRSDLTQWVVVLLGLGVGRFLLGLTYRYALFQLAWNVETDVRALLYDHLTTLSFSYYDRTQSGQVISRANSDIRSIQLLLAYGPLIMMSGLAFVLALGFMLTIHVPLTLVAMTTLPMVYVAGQKLRTTVFPLTWVSQARMAELATIVDENVNGTRVVKSFAAEERQVNLLARAADHLHWANVQAIKTRARYTPFIEALPRLGMALVLLYGGILAIDGKVSIGTLFAFNAYVIMMQAPFRMFGFILLQAQRASASATRIYEVLDETADIADAPDAKDLTRPAGDIEFSDVHFTYPNAAMSFDEGVTPHRLPVLTGFDLSIAAGETIAIVGRTGSGKSTVARLLARFYEADNGTIAIDGHPIDSVTLASLRHHVGLVFDEPFLFSSTVRDNIAYGLPNAPLDDIVRAATAAQAHGFITDLENGYDTVVGERGYTLSGGQRQRIAIARTLLENPPILILDDATSAIDVTVEAAIHHALHELLADRTTILIAHRLSTIALADRVVLLEAGQIVATGTHSELLATEPRYVQILAEAETKPQEAP
ncbi:MAG: ATP-binding cassette subfamily B protein [Acidimicrobiales bacterium]|jgi:ATP-binding cassette subfamily B protein